MSGLQIVELGFLQLLGGAQHGVERRPQFVARDRQKTAFRLVGAFRRFGRPLVWRRCFERGEHVANPPHGRTEDE